MDDVLRSHNPVVLRGTVKVKFFDNHPDKQFGFFSTDKGVDIFFHKNTGVSLWCSGSDSIDYLAGVRVPVKGDNVICLIVTTPKGLRATNWWIIDQEEYDLVHKQILERPIYRVIRRQGKKKWGKLAQLGTAEEETVWEGCDTVALRQKYQPSDFRYRIHSAENSLFRIEKYINDRWEECDDPR